ncbi:hypothetical protein TNCV_926201 [Trichonephila clavipes]|nr:hypothetical protein TNCV_926201 [Trichonephila clavipes]
MPPPPRARPLALAQLVYALRRPCRQCYTSKILKQINVPCLRGLENIIYLQDNARAHVVHRVVVFRLSMDFKCNTFTKSLTQRKHLIGLPLCRFYD